MTLFLQQLFSMLDDARMRPYITWNAEGNGFIIPDVSLFEQHCLPVYYKHK